MKYYVTFNNFSIALCLPLLWVIIFPFRPLLMTAVSKSCLLLVSYLPELCISFLDSQVDSIAHPPLHWRIF